MPYPIIGRALAAALTTLAPTLSAAQAHAGHAHAGASAAAPSASAAAPPAAMPAKRAAASAFEGYRGFADPEPLGWREANDAVARIGGWRAYAKEAAAAQGDDAGRHGGHDAHGKR